MGEMAAERGGAGGMGDDADAGMAAHVHAGPSGGAAELSGAGFRAVREETYTVDE